MDYPTTQAISCMGDLPSAWTNGRITTKAQIGKAAALTVVEERERWAAREDASLAALKAKGIDVITGIDEASFPAATSRVRDGFRAM